MSDEVQWSSRMVYTETGEGIYGCVNSTAQLLELLPLCRLSLHGCTSQPAIFAYILTHRGYSGGVEIILIEKTMEHTRLVYTYAVTKSSGVSNFGSSSFSTTIRTSDAVWNAVQQLRSPLPRICVSCGTEKRYNLQEWSK
jgi:hypothetical protein